MKRARPPKTTTRASARRGEPERERAPRAAADAAWLYGMHTISAWLDARPARFRVLYRDERASEAVRALAARAERLGIPVRAETAEAIAARAGAKRHQGIAAEASAFPYAAFEEVLARAPNLIAVVDQLQDPHNLGAIVRSAEAAGAGGLLLPRDNCVGVTAVVEATSAGMSAWLPIARVTNLARALTQLKQAGYWIAGLSMDASDDLFRFTPPERVALLIGGESGIRPLVLRQLDFCLRIPMQGHAESLNASVAAALGLFTLRTQMAAAAEGCS